MRHAYSKLAFVVLFSASAISSGADENKPDPKPAEPVA